MPSWFSFPLRFFGGFSSSQYLPAIKLLLKPLLTFFHGSSEWRKAEFFYFSGRFLAERLEIVSLTEENRCLHIIIRTGHLEKLGQRKWMESFAGEHIKLLIASDIVVVTWESYDHGICSLWWLYQILYSFLLSTPS